MVFETATKMLITNGIWIPIHLAWLGLAWLWAGVSLHRLDLPARTQRGINLLMALAMVSVVALAAWSAMGGDAIGGRESNDDHRDLC